MKRPYKTSQGTHVQGTAHLSNGWTESAMQTEQRRARILAATVKPVDTDKFNIAMLFIDLQEKQSEFLTPALIATWQDEPMSEADRVSA